LLIVAGLLLTMRQSFHGIHLPGCIIDIGVDGAFFTALVRAAHPALQS
jgi:hypothetical protein